LFWRLLFNLIMNLFFVLFVLFCFVFEMKILLAFICALLLLIGIVRAQDTDGHDHHEHDHHGHDHHGHDHHGHGHDHHGHGHDQETEQEKGKEQEQENVQKVVEQLEGSPDVVCDFFFPNLTGYKSVGGEPVEVLMVLSNNGESPFKIHTISASLRHPLDYRYIIQNFTSWEYGSVVAPKEEMSFSYTFFTWELEERDYYLLVTVEYTDLEDRLYQTAFYNGTFALTEPPATVDGKTFFTYCGLLAAVILAGFVFFKSKGTTQSKPQREKPEKSSKKSTGGNEKITVDNEWIKGSTAASWYAKK